MKIRQASPVDYPKVIRQVNDWWGGRNMSNMLPKLFFVHFRSTSFIAENEAGIIGFLIGFISQTHPKQAYIHFVGIHPHSRNKGIGRALYELFFHTVQSLGCTQVRCVTAPINQQSIAYHLHMGFQPEGGDDEIDSVPYYCDYDGVGEDRVVFVKHLQ
ncbi:MAG: GNAT family N-acetyltransferase [Spirulinaceae cyanobacterium]